jgi:beta-lactamase regulating signal transducer with metallopeptidase domain
MTAGLLLYVALVIALSALAGWALESLCRQVGRPARWAWLTATVMAFALVARAAVADSAAPLSVTYERLAMPAATTTAATSWSPLGAMHDALALSVAAIGSATDAVLRFVPARATTLLFGLWLALSLLALATLALVHLRIRRSRREWVEAELHGTRVRIAPAVGPAVVGVMRPQIVVPRWLLGCSADEQQLVLAHEREHIGARDHQLLGAGSLLVALVPWHPAAWWMLARLRLAIELDCDARVLRGGVPAKTYGTLLIDLADRCTGFRVGATALADEGSHLERRLLAMKTNRMKRPLLRAGMFGTAAALALLAACEAKVPTGPEIEAMDVASASKAVAGTRIFQKTQLDSATFYVDGVQVDSRTANAFSPDQIAAIDITKNPVTGRNAIIRITTNGEPRLAPGTPYKGSTQVSVHGDQMLRTVPPNGSEPGGAAKKFEGLLLIDGVKSDQSALATLDRTKIESIDIIKGAAAEKLSSDPLAKNGIIRVTTKK